MLDARDEIARGFAEISAVYRRVYPSRLQPNAPSLFEYAWKTFDAKRCLAVLISEEPTYTLQKDLLFSALCTWVVCPHRAGLRRHGMVLVAIEAMCWNEGLGQAAFPDDKLLGDIFGRISPEYWDFYLDFYYPIGGLKALIKSTSPNTFRKSVEKRSSDVPNVIGLMSVLHYHADHLRGNGPYLQASLNKAAPATETVYSSGKRSGWTADNIDDRWQKLKGTAALSYAASSLMIDQNHSFLDIVRSGEASYAEHGQYLVEWIARANYAAAHVLAPMKKPDAARAAESYLPNVEPSPFGARVFTSEQERRIRQGFKTHNPS